MRDRLSRSVLRYYVALRLTAGAASAAWPQERLRESAPVVRIARGTLAGFDERERWIAPDGRIGIVTLPAPQARTQTRGVFSLN